MNLGQQWDYLNQVAEQRLARNKTIYHVSKYGSDIEVLGAAGELAARRFLGLSERLHLNKDDGVDFYWRNYRVDVKATHMTRYLNHRYLQWPHYKPVKAELVLMTAVNLKRKRATVVGFATAAEILTAPINTTRDIPCHEIPLTMLHAAWKLQTLPYAKRHSRAGRRTKH